MKPEATEGKLVILTVYREHTEKNHGLRYLRESRSYGKGADLLVIEDIPLVSCPHCGESYLTAETLLEIERIKLHRKNWAKARKVAVAMFG